MLAFLPSLILFASAAALAILHITRPGFRFFWIAGVSSVLLAAIATVLWPRAAPLAVQLPSWQPPELFSQSIAFRTDALSWPIAFGLCTLNLAVLLTSGRNPDTAGARTGYGILILTGLGLLAILAANPLTIVLIWTAFDLVEVAAQAWSTAQTGAGPRAVPAFSGRVLSSGLVLWAGLMESGNGTEPAFGSMSEGANLLLVVAAGLRLGISSRYEGLRPEGGSAPGPELALALTAVTATLAPLCRVSLSPSGSFALTVLMLLFAVASLSAGWGWLRGAGKAAARARWILACGALVAFACLRGQPQAASAWTTALLLGGGCLFLNTARTDPLNRLVLVGMWSLSALPFSLTASTWVGASGMALVLLPLVAGAQALLMAGYVLHARGSSGRPGLDEGPAWIRSADPIGLGALVAAGLLIGVWGWPGAGLMGNWPVALGVAAASAALVALSRQLRTWSPAVATRAGLAVSRAERLPDLLRPAHGWLERLTGAVAATLEGEGAVMWTLLFLVLLVSLLAGAAP